MAYGKVRVDSIESSTRTISVDNFAVRTEIVNADINTAAEIAVSKLANGIARQLLQTDSAGTGVEWTSNIDVPGTLDVTGAATFDSSVSIAGDLVVTGSTVNIDAQNLVVEDKNIIIGDTASPSNLTADNGGVTLKGATDKTFIWLNSTSSWTSSENLDLATGKSYRINNTEVLSSTALGAGVTGSSLTSVGTLSTGTWQATAIADAYIGTISSAGKVLNSATTATSANTASAIVARDASGNFSAGTITANLTGTASAIADSTVTDAKVAAGAAIAHDKLASITAGSVLLGNGSNVPTATALSGDVTINSSGVTAISSGVIVNADISASAAIDPSKVSGTAVVTSDSRLSDARTPTDGSVTDAKVASNAAIAGTKISPDFGAQNVLTTGNVGVNVSPTEKLHVGGNILATGNVTAYSDIRVKENIEPLQGALGMVMELQGVKYDRIGAPEEGRHIGLIAQEVEKVVPEVVKTHSDGIKSLAYANLVALLIEAVKEQQGQIEELRMQLEAN